MLYILIFESGGSIEFRVLGCAEIYWGAWGGTLYAVDLFGAVSGLSQAVIG
jgi:hypothetical protein